MLFRGDPGFSFSLKQGCLIHQFSVWLGHDLKNRFLLLFIKNKNIPDPIFRFLLVSKIISLRVRNMSSNRNRGGLSLVVVTLSLLSHAPPALCLGLPSLHSNILDQIQRIAESTGDSFLTVQRTPLQYPKSWLAASVPHPTLPSELALNLH